MLCILKDSFIHLNKEYLPQDNANKDLFYKLQ